MLVESGFLVCVFCKITIPLLASHLYFLIDIEEKKILHDAVTIAGAQGRRYRCMQITGLQPTCFNT